MQSALKKPAVCPEYRHLEPYQLYLLCLSSAAAISTVLLLAGCSCRQEKPVPRTAPDAEGTRSNPSPIPDPARNSTPPGSTRAGDGGHAEDRSASDAGSVDRGPNDSNNHSAETTSQTGGGANHELGRKHDRKGRADNGTNKEPASAAEAHDKATLLLQEARRDADRDDFAKAFQKGAAAWQLLRHHPDDPSCRKLAVRVQKALKDYGDELNKDVSQEGGVTELKKPLHIE